MKQRGLVTRMAIALALVVALSTGAIAGEIRKGTTRQVKPNSIWFQDTAKLAQWQEFKKNGVSTALEAYQVKVLSLREAWQFTTQLTIEVLGTEPGKNQVNVEMKTPGRLLGSTWFLDSDALVQ